MPSNLRALVQWRDQSVFAGEDIECVITFKNISRTPQQRERDGAQSKQRSRLEALQPILERQRNVTASTTFTRQSFNRRLSITSNSTVAPRLGHKATLSLDVGPSTPPSQSTATMGRPKAHGRSLSILSISADNSGPKSARNPLASPGRPLNHRRSASLQVVSGGVNGGQAAGRFSNPNSPALREIDEAGSNVRSPGATRRRSGTNTAPATPALLQGGGQPMPASMSPHFKFPASDSQPGLTSPKSAGGPVQSRRASQILSPVSPGQPVGLAISSLTPTALGISNDGINGTSRTSSEMYAASNVSDDTISSELPANSLLQRPPLSRQSSQRRAPGPRKPDPPEHLMMGYVQTMGSFSVDGSLINQLPFEEVKRKGVISSQAGGGVVGVEQAKRQSGLLGGFGWSTIGESLTGLLGMDEMSSMREMKNVASMKAIPLLSTPQSLLFVDLKLAAGESKSYTYKFKVPKGLPPTHKGRAIKVTYHLRIAVQRNGSLDGKNIKHVEVPFRVLGSVDRDGDLLGHDLMSPYVLLQDVSKTALLPQSIDVSRYFSPSEDSKDGATPTGTMDDFLRYTERLMEEQPAGAPLISPTATSHERRFSTDVPQARTMKERIDLAILRSNQNLNADDDAPIQSTNRFTIARSGQHVGVLTIMRPAYRLGETIHIKIDFTLPIVESQPQQAFLTHIYLETLENIDPSLALRSAASIQRVTRKIHASASQTVFFARQTGVALEIPALATPSFETTGIQLNWRIRVEFVTSILESHLPSDSYPEEHDFDENDHSGSSDGEATHPLNRTPTTPTSRPGFPKPTSPQSRRSSAGPAALQQASVSATDYPTTPPLLELISTDDRGRILVARERLPAESWEVSVPIKVYGVQQRSGNAADGPGSAAAVSELLEI